MTTQMLHPDMDPVEAVRLLERARHGDTLEVCGLDSLRDVRRVQALADAADTPVTWRHRRHGTTAAIVVDRTPT